MKKASEQKFVDELDRAIDFHCTNPDDPYNLGPAVVSALLEVRNAFASATGKEVRLWRNSRIAINAPAPAVVDEVAKKVTEQKLEQN